VTNCAASSTGTVMIMAAGTGGHVFPALAVAEALREQGYDVHWLGTGKGLEAKVVPAANFPLHCIDIAGLRGKGALGWFAAPWRITRAVWQARRIFKQQQAQVVIGFGGFVTGPGGIAAALSGIPLFIHEQNAIPGLTNRWLAKVATGVMSAFPNSFAATVGAQVTGNPLRANIMALNAQEIARPRQPLRVLVVGGSLGALALNEAVPASLTQLGLPLEVRHQTGTAHIEAMQVAYAAANFPVEVLAFIEDMAAAYAWADVAICRAGALTVSELAQAGLPAILIPYPHAVDDHQTHNARYLSDRGAAILLPQTELSVAGLTKLLHTLYNEPTQLQQMAQAAQQCAQPNALQQVLAPVQAQLQGA